MTALLTDLVICRVVGIRARPRQVGFKVSCKFQELPGYLAVMSDGREPATSVDCSPQGFELIGHNPTSQLTRQNAAVWDL
jgi:hypothetical protein